MTLAANLVALIAALVGSDRAWPVAVANDQALNAALVGRSGSEDETVSSRAGKAAQSGRRWGCILCRMLDWFDPATVPGTSSRMKAVPSKKEDGDRAGKLEHLPAS